MRWIRICLMTKRLVWILEVNQKWSSFHWHLTKAVGFIQYVEANYMYHKTAVVFTHLMKFLCNTYFFSFGTSFPYVSRNTSCSLWHTIVEIKMQEWYTVSLVWRTDDHKATLEMWERKKADLFPPGSSLTRMARDALLPRNRRRSQSSRSSKWAKVPLWFIKKGKKYKKGHNHERTVMISKQKQVLVD